MDTTNIIFALDNTLFSRPS